MIIITHFKNRQTNQSFYSAMSTKHNKLHKSSGVMQGDDALNSYLSLNGISHKEIFITTVATKQDLTFKNLS